MFAKNPEARIGMKILAALGFLIIAVLIGGFAFLKIRSPQLLEFSKGIQEIDLKLQLDSIEGAYFLHGMTACENIYLDNDSTLFYVTSLQGDIYQVDTSWDKKYKILNTVRAGTMALGITKGSDGLLYVVISRNRPDDWKTKGAGLFSMSGNLDSIQRLTPDFPSMNGLTCDGQGNLYFASSNFQVFHPQGAIYIMKYAGGGKYGEPSVFIDDAGLANGMYYSKEEDEVIYSNTIGGVYSFIPGADITQVVYLKLKFMEACDDLCTDISGNIWMTDPGYSTIKVLNPGTGKLIRFNIEGVGQTSSCRIRTEKGVEMLYITEIKQKQEPMSNNFDGRGVLIVPAQSLLKIAQPLLLNAPPE